MRVYEYEVVDRGGRVVTGQAEAGSVTEFVRRLGAEGNTVVEVSERRVSARSRAGRRFGALSGRVAETLGREGHGDSTAHSITVSRERLYHVGPRKVSSQRLIPADLDRLPQGLARPRAVLYDTRRRELVYAYDATAPEKDIVKVVVRPNMSQSLKVGGRPRETVTSHSVRTAGYVQRANLAESRYQLIEGSLEDSAADDGPVVVGRPRPGASRPSPACRAAGAPRAAPAD